MPPGHCLGALEMLKQKFTISLLMGALYQGKNALVPLPFRKTKHTGLSDQVIRSNQQPARFTGSGT